MEEKKAKEIAKTAFELIVSQADLIDELQAELAEVKKQRISNSCVPCASVDGDCCGMIHWSDDGKFLCNECGREFVVTRWIPVEERLPGDIIPIGDAQSYQPKPCVSRGKGGRDAR